MAIVSTASASGSDASGSDGALGSDFGESAFVARVCTCSAADFTSVFFVLSSGFDVSTAAADFVDAIEPVFADA
jgi:hypothetical protein